VTVLIVEDDPRFRDAFVRAVRAASDMSLAGEAADYATGLSALSRKPDVLLVDLDLPDGNGIDLIREAAAHLPSCDIMVVTVFGDEQHVLRSIEAGATGYLLKDMPPETIVEQIRVLRAGGSPISPFIARQLLTRLSGPPTAATGPALDGEPQSRLSAQETKVLSLAAKGYTYDEVAELMLVSRHTVQTYVKRLYRKLQVGSKLAAVQEATRLQLLNDA
jgi:DNA-binding NarL/FixJ family response regulator